MDHDLEPTVALHPQSKIQDLDGFIGRRAVWSPQVFKFRCVSRAACASPEVRGNSMAT